MCNNWQYRQKFHVLKAISKAAYSLVPHLSCCWQALSSQRDHKACQVYACYLDIELDDSSVVA